jgi:chromosome segregation ATPase
MSNRDNDGSDDLTVAYEQRTKQLCDARAALAEAVAALTVELGQRREESAGLREELARLREESARLREESARLREELARLREELARTGDERDRVLLENEALRGSAKALSAGVQEAREHAAAVEAELGVTRERVAALRNMKVVRWTAGPRRIVHRLRDRLE